MVSNIIGLYSKRQEFTGHPQYYKKAKGCYVWAKKDDKLHVKENTKLLDMSTMGIGTCLLGYNNPVVNCAVKKAINNGNMSSLQPDKEIELANMLCEIEPWASHVRFARSGGEAMAIAYRIACAVSGKHGIISQGYHGWELEENENIIRKIKVNEFINIYDNLNLITDKISCIIIEGIRNVEPNDFGSIVTWCHCHNVLLIVDEITSGFRFDLGSYFLKCKRPGGSSYYLPDILVFGKAISNGYPMSAILMTDNVYKNGAEKCFISSTYFTESVGINAAIATINELSRMNYDYLYEVGKTVQDIWEGYARKYNIDIKINEVPNLAHFEFDYDTDTKLYYKSIFVECMLQCGILAGDSFYPSFSHTQKHLEQYSAACDYAFQMIDVLGKNELFEPYILIKERPIKT